MRLLGNKTIIEVKPQKSASGILLPESMDTPSQWRRGTIVMMGEGVKPECKVKVGDDVLFQFGFDKLFSDSLYRLASDDSKVFVEAGELWIGNPESLFAVMEKKHGKKETKKA